MGGVIRIPISAARAGKTNETFSVTLGSRERHSPYTAELAAIAHGLGCLPEIEYRVIVILTSNRSAAQAISNPRRQSGQGVNFSWLPPDSKLKIRETAKMSTRYATEPYMTL
ncbi:hypothetical protein FOCG_18465 [Fusarium oxysporum f. sp. radicis-lycopersici 26381]|nr:hypothetical protein FOCG_18465 [Fusarium oxysporum f. sp. radicis-lycopersici 26381]